jgi:hypothetical protein
MHLITEHEMHKAKTDKMTKEIDESSIIIGDFNTPVSDMDRFSRHKISEDKIELDNTVN